VYGSYPLQLLKELSAVAGAVVRPSRPLGDVALALELGVPEHTGPCARPLSVTAMATMISSGAAAVYAMTEKPPFRRYYSLRDQIERAAVSISNNIAEGFERGTNQCSAGSAF